MQRQTASREPEDPDDDHHDLLVAASVQRRAGPRSMVALLLLGVGALSCGHAQMATVTEGSAQAIPAKATPDVAVKTVDGVRLYASGDAWNGLPASVGSSVTPLAVRIENHSGGPIRVVYERFALVTAGGREFHPLPLLPLSGRSAKIATLQPAYQPAGFFIAPRFSPTYSSLPAWRSQLPRDESLYRLDYRKWSDDLPSPDMLIKGLPEGVLEDGGSISGFLYFDGEARGQHDLTFRADVTAGDWDRRVALIEIPFRIQ